MFDTLRVYDDHDAKSAAMNMAVDEALLADASEPILRFYRWRQPSLSFGYFGLYAEAVRHGNGREIIPAAWVKESTREYWKPAQLHGPYRDGPAGYGYLWWTPSSRTSPEWKDAF